MAISKITTKAITDGTIATADLADNAVNSAKIGADVIVAEDVANNAITVNEIQNGAVTSAKLDTNIAITGNLTVDTSTLKVDASNNRVGVGTTAPTSPLHVVSGEIGNGQNKGIKIANHNASKAYSIRTGITGSENSSLSIHDDTAGASRITIDTSGQVGIGTTSPDQPLDIAYTNNQSYSVDNFTNSNVSGLRIENTSTTANAFSNLTFRVGSGADLFFGIEQKSGNDGDFIFANQNSPNIEMMRITSAGNVGIGDSSPDAKLDVHGNVVFGDGGGFDMNINGTRHQFSIGGTERMRIDGSGRVGIGAFNNGDYHVNNDDLLIATSGSTGITIASGTIDQGRIAFADGTGDNTDEIRGLIMYNHNGNAMTFHSNVSERVRITSGGKVLINTTNIIKGMFNVNLSTNDTASPTVNISGDGSSQAWVSFSDTSNTTYGSIRRSGSSTAYNTSSDYRLKENVSYDFDATSRLKKLKPCRFNFIEDDTNTLIDGFLAHEVTSIVPEAISGDKDAMTKEVLYVEDDEIPDGKKVGDVKEASKIDPQGIDQSKLVPLLVKTIQELEARITTLESA